MSDEERRIAWALECARRYGQTDGAHHKAWVIDQMVRALLGCMPTVNTYGFRSFDVSEQYRSWIASATFGEDGPNTYSWDEGIAP